MSTITIGLAQFTPTKGHIADNLTQHISLIETAANKRVDLLVFPELSLTGYEPELASKLSMTLESEPILLLDSLAKKHSMTILAGAPFDTGYDQPELSLIILSPENAPQHYSKIHLHGIEKQFFRAGIHHKIFTINSFKIGLAICADTTHQEHIQHMINKDVDCYIASVLISKQGYAADAAMFTQYAQQHSVTIGFANYIGHSGPYICAGKSAFWNKEGEIISQCSCDEPELLITTLTS
ncbi:carbon-nitrogen hydrolase family protein [Halodesulfovibrio spirochaetisodalis]|uniref:carbon-nitrogen hydrolase family protein n=1 Tax=Halodesulfovibrio spirochaetisodalis TaxID=1560234 RepID=UPI000831BEF2|nr:carbon-nitrogen hydrolase family protein [Halodesulfovibrio spirochaetisodalis]